MQRTQLFNLTRHKVAKLAGEAWRAMSTEEKSPYLKEAEEKQVLPCASSSPHHHAEHLQDCFAAVPQDTASGSKGHKEIKKAVWYV